MAVSVQQACLNALETFLTLRMGDVDVSSRWPNPDKQLPPKAITILLSGPRALEWYEPEVVGSAVVTGNLVEYTWAVAHVTQPLQLDVWALSHSSRDDILARLDTLLITGTITTLGGPYGDSVGNGLLLPLADGFTGNADFIFEGPSIIDNPNAKQQNEHRAMWTGSVGATLTVKAQTYKIARIKLKERLYEGSEPSPSAGTDVYDIDATGVTYTHTTP